MKKMIKYLIAAFFVGFSANSVAIDYTEVPAYEIEVIVFKFNDSRSAGNEIWPDLVEPVSVENSIELHNNYSFTLTPGVDTKGYYYAKLPEDKYRLSDELGKLTASKEYEVLYHSAWIQPGLDKENAESIHIKSNGIIVNPSMLNPIAPAPVNNLLVANNPLITGQNKVTTDDAILDGLIKVELGRYLHIHFDLKYQRDLAPGQGILNANLINTYKQLKYYPVQTHRRMRSKEVHYIDHPLIGILVLATPFELPDQDAESDTVNAPLMKLGDVPVSQ